MSYIVKRLPNVEELKKQIKESPSIINYYAKFEDYIRDIHSINYILTKTQTQNKNNDDSKKN